MGLSLAEVAERSDVPTSLVRDLARIGVTARPDSFEAGDVHRVSTAAAFLEAGFTIDQLATAIRQHELDFAFAEVLTTEPTADPGCMLADLAARLGEPVGQLRRVYGAFGLPLPSDRTQLSPSEAALVTEFVRAWRTAGPEATVRAARLVGDGARRASEGWVALFVERVSSPAMSRSGTYAEYAQAALRPAADLVQLAPRLLAWLQSRHTDHALLQANLQHFERRLVATELVPAPERRHPVIAFADLVGFTTLTEKEGDARALAAVEHLQVSAEDAARDNGGRVVKLLGDGALLRFEDVAAAAVAMLRLGAVVAEHGIATVHAGMERGPVIERDGDVYGGTVNLAARVAASAAAGQVLAGPGAANALQGDPGFEVTPRGSREFRGLDTPVPVWEVRAADRR